MDSKRLKQVALENLLGDGVSDTTAPSVSTFTLTTPSISLNVTITAFTASEAGVSFIITESSTPPDPEAAGWEASAPATYTVSADGTYTLYPWVKDAAGNVSDEFGSPRTVFVLAYPFTDNFTRANGAIGGQWTGATWTIASNVALNTPTEGAEKIVNGNMETGDPPSSWTLQNGATLDGVADERTGGTGVQSISVTRGTADLGARQTFSCLSDEWYACSGWLKKITASNAAITFSAGGANFQLYSTSAAWVNQITTLRTSTTTTLCDLESGTSGECRFDDISAKPLTLATLFATLPDMGVASVTAQVVITANPGNTCGGLLLNLDSVSSPLNFVIAYIRFGRAKLDKCVNGVYSNVIDGAVSYSATSNMKLIKSGNNYSLYYGAVGSETQVGTTQSIASMNGTIHGLFSTNSTPKFDTYQLAAT